MSVLTDLRNRGVKDVFFVVCDGLKGLPDVVASVWPQAIVQTCDFIPGTCGTFPPSDWGPTHPAWFYDSALESPQLQVRYALGWVDADVTSVVVRLRDGQQLKLIPVSRYGQRLVAFVIPMQTGIVGATAYLNNGRFATTMPSNSPDALTFVNSWVWHRPDAPATTT